MSTTDDLDALFAAVRARYDRFGDDDEGRARLVAFLRSVARLDEEPMDYDQEAAATFPDRVPVAFAVCHPECGRKELLVDGSTQVCQGCGGLMFRTESRWYEQAQGA